MLPITLDSHFTFGYGDQCFNIHGKTKPNELWCKYSRCSRNPLTLREECGAVAKLLHDAALLHKRTPMIMLSGGLDSEIVVRSFMDQNLLFEAITFKYKNGLNDHEIEYVKKFSARFNVPVRYFEIDFPVWIQSSEAAQMAQISHAPSFALISHMKLMKEIWSRDGLPILGNGDVYLERLNHEWQYVELEEMLSWFRYAISEQIIGGIGFFQHTPEITLAMVQEPQMMRLGMNKNITANSMLKNSRNVKYAIYRKHWPELISRPKFGGYEYVIPLIQKLNQNHDQIISYDDKVVIPFQEFKAMLEPYHIRGRT